jgi:hypothetical protein
MAAPRLTGRLYALLWALLGLSSQLAQLHDEEVRHALTASSGEQLRAQVTDCLRSPSQSAESRECAFAQLSLQLREVNDSISRPSSVAASRPGIVEQVDVVSSYAVVFEQFILQKRYRGYSHTDTGTLILAL